MKKMIWAFFVSVFCIPTFATECVRIEPDVIFDTFFDDQDTQINVLNTYLHEIENGPCKNVAAVDAKGLWNLCKAAKINIKTPEGKTDCSNKLDHMLEYSTTVANKFYPVCDNPNSVPQGTSAKCETLIFAIRSVKVNQGIILAKLFEDKFYLTDLECSNKFRLKKAPNKYALHSYFLQCYSASKNTYYEFVFKSLAEQDESHAKKDVLETINFIYSCGFNEKNQMCILNEQNYEKLVNKLPELGIKNFKVQDFGNYGKWAIDFKEVFVPTDIDDKTINKAMKHLSKSDKITFRDIDIVENGIIDFEKLSDTDKEFYKLWKEYAPRNQTFDDFKAMANGNLDNMKKMAESWPTREEINKHNYEAQIKYNQEREILQNKKDTKATELEKLKNEIAAHETTQSANNTELEELSKRRELLEQELNQVNHDLENQPKPDLMYGAYTTHDPKLDKINKKVSKLDEKWGQINERVKEYDSEQDKKKLDKIETKLGKQQIKLGDKYPLENLGNVVNERVQNYEDIINSNSEIKSKLDATTWQTLDADEKLEVAQIIIDEYAKNYGGPIIPIRYEERSDATIGYAHDGKLFLTDYSLETPEEMLDTLSHEHGHMIDGFFPDQGVLGSQLSTTTMSAYVSDEDKGYFVSPTEKSSFAIGAAVSEKITGTERKNEAINTAVEHLQEEINYINAKKQK